MRLRVAPFLVLVGAMCCLLPSEAQTSATRSWALIIDFEGDQPLAGWYTTAHEGKLTVATAPELVASGRAALQLDYQPRIGCLSLLGVKSLALQARPRSLCFRLRTSSPTPVLFGVTEADGSAYESYCYSAPGQWHQVTIDLDELMLGSSASDENDFLDTRQITEIFFGDLSNLPGEVGKSLGLKEGPQTLWLDDISLSTTLAPHRSHRTATGDVIIYDFDAAPPPCLPLGGPELSLVAGPGSEDPWALRVDYDNQGYRWVGFVAGVGHLRLSGRQEICLTLRSDNQAKLILVLEERDGSKYTTRLTLDPAQGWHTVRLPFSSFQLDSGTKDENATLDLDQLRVIIPVVDSQRAQLTPIDGGLRGSYTISRIWCPVAEGQ